MQKLTLIWVQFVRSMASTTLNRLGSYEDATDENDPTSFGERPASLQLEFDELNIRVNDAGQSVAAEESRASPPLRELGELLAWGVGVATAHKDTHTLRGIW